MEGQVEQMKESIANIQHHLRKLECDQAFKDHEAILLPESIIHEHVYEKPKPTPKITSTHPNITNTQVYTPSRHHLDDTQMKKILRDEPSESNRRSKKEKSLTAKTKYIYDGARVVYIPPLLKTQSDYGHLVVEADRKRNKLSQSQSSRNFGVHQEYGEVIRRTSKKQRKPAMKQVRTKMSQMTKLPTDPYMNVYAEASNQYQATVIQKKDKKTKSRKAQCNIVRTRLKEPFLVDWKADTDSEFSGMEI